MAPLPSPSVDMLPCHAPHDRTQGRLPHPVLPRQIPLLHPTGGVPAPDLAHSLRRQLRCVVAIADHDRPVAPHVSTVLGGRPPSQVRPVVAQLVVTHPVARHVSERTRSVPRLTCQVMHRVLRSTDRQYPVPIGDGIRPHLASVTGTVDRGQVVPPRLTRCCAALAATQGIAMPQESLVVRPAPALLLRPHRPHTALDRAGGVGHAARRCAVGSDMSVLLHRIGLHRGLGRRPVQLSPGYQLRHLVRCHV